MSKLLGERYQLIKLIGKGGMADVYLALDTILNREVAVKILKNDLKSDANSLERFRREALASTKLSHPNIVDVYDVGDDEQYHYIVMEYVKGYTLKQLIKVRGALNEKEAVWIMKQLCSAIMEAHKNNIIHRDIKSQNVLIKSDGTVKITDFGIAMNQDGIELTSKNSIMGSVQYLAPEIVKGEVASMQSDIYSLGIVFYELLTGDLPFKGDSAVQIALKHVKEEIPSVKNFDNNIHQSIENIVIKATAKSLSNRYTNVAFMLKDLNDCLKQEHFADEKLILKKELEEKVMNDIKKEKKEKKSNNLALIIFLICVFLISGILFYFIGSISGLFDKNKMVEIPQINGLTIVEASDILDSNNLSIDLNAIERIMTDDTKAGLIISSSPEQGTLIDRGSRIKIVVSKGIYSLVEDYIGRNIDEVKEELKDSNFYVSTNAVKAPDKEEPGTIVNQSIEPNFKYDASEPLKISFDYVEYEYVMIPLELIGKEITEAKQTLLGLKFKVKLEEIKYSELTEYEKDNSEVYTVARMSPDAGKYCLVSDTEVTIYYYTSEE